MGERQEAESRPWTVDEMRKGSGSWSLASDAGMLQHLQEYSQKMISRTHDIQKQVSSLLDEAKLTSVRVNNTFNDFIMLANTQFVENRVYDEDVTQEASEEETVAKKEKTKEEREAELVPRVAMAMKLGLEVIDSAFEKLDLNEANSDSEDEDGTYRGEPLLEAKDPYLSRPLPYMIGSPSFLQDDDVGLIDFISEDEEEPVQAEESETESESEEESPDLVTRQHKREQSDSDEYSEGSDLFQEGDSDSDDLESGVPPSTKQPADSDDEPSITTGDGAARDFASELAAKITAAPVVPPEQVKEKQGPAKKKKEKSKKQERKPPDDEDLFAPPSRSVDALEEDDDSPFGRSGGLFSGSTGGGLFDDEDDLFSDATARPTKQKLQKPAAAPKPEEPSSSSEDDAEAPPTKPANKQKQKPVGGVSMFGGDDPDDLFSIPTSDPAPPKAANPPQSVKVQAPPSSHQSAGGSGLFDNSEDEEEDFFAAVSKSAKVKEVLPSKPAQKSLGKGLFDDEEGDLFGDESPPKPPAKETIKKPEKKLPAGAVSMFGSGKNPLLDALKAKQRPADDSESGDDQTDDDWKSGKSGASRSNASSKSANRVPDNKSATNQSLGPKPRSGSASSNSLFADDGDDLFDSSGSKPTKKPTPIAALATNGPSKMFDEEDEDDLFKIDTKPKVKAPVEKAVKQSGLFDDEEEEVDIFATEPPPLTQPIGKKKPVGGVSLFGGADLFGDSLPAKKSPAESAEENFKTKPAEVVHTKTEQIPAKNNADTVPTLKVSENRKVEKPLEKKKSSPLSLFNDESEAEEDDIFAQVTSTKPSVKPTLGVKPKAAKPHSEPQATGKVGRALTPSAQDDLFNEGSDEDLFGDSKLAQAVKPKPVEKPAVQNSPNEPQQVQKVGGVTTKSSTTDIFNDSEEEDLFGDSNKPSTVVAEPLKPRKPAGAVSMFGGVDPSAMLGKKTGNAAQHQDLPEKMTKPIAEPLVASVTTNSSPSTIQPKGPGPVVSPKAKGSSVQNLQSQLAINPSSLLPGAAPPVQEVTETGVGFDDPPQSQTLQSIAKDRVKLRTGRRPPSRHARISRAAESGPEYSNTSDPTSHNVTAANITDAESSRLTFPNSSATLPNGDIAKHGEPSQKNIDAFMKTNQNEGYSIKGKDPPKPIVNQKADLFQSNSDEEGDIFGTSMENTAVKGASSNFLPRSEDGVGKSTKTDNITGFDPMKTDAVIDIVAQDSAETDDVNATEKVQSWLEHSEPVTKPSSKSVFEEGDEDIFESSPPPSKSLSHGDLVKPQSLKSQTVRSSRSGTISSHHSTLSNKSSEKLKEKDDNLVRDNPDLQQEKADILDAMQPKEQSKAVIDEDIFAGTEPKSRIQIRDDNDDDLFTSSKLTSSSSKPKVPLISDDDDLFSSSKLSVRSKPVVKIDDDIFSSKLPSRKTVEDDDIFADILKPTGPVKTERSGDDINSESKSGQKAKPKQTADPAEVDDIFADISSQPIVSAEVTTGDADTTVKSSRKTKKPKKAVVKDEDIFKDDTDIFADIPAAKPKQPKAKKSKTQNNPLFGGETDDIFADTSSSSTKPKKSKKTQKTSSKAATATFDKDAPNIFDDPLSALDS